MSEYIYEEGLHDYKYKKYVYTVCMYVCITLDTWVICMYHVCMYCECTCRVLLLLETADHKLEALASEKLELIFSGH